VREHKQNWEEEHKDDEAEGEDKPEYAYDVEERTIRISNFLDVMAHAAKFALNSKSWLQLTSIIMYTWNAIAYDLTTPLDLMHTDAWKDFVVIAECSLYLMEYLQKGGKLRQIAGRHIDEVKNQKSA
jgi:hypothetical protein